MSQAGRSPADEFFSALNGHDVDRLRACLHPDFEMVVPQKPARGFVGCDQEIANMRLLFDTYPDFAVTVLRTAVDGDDVWTETVATATDLEMAAVVIWTIDRDNDVLVRGRYYSEPVQRDAPVIDEFMRDLATGHDGAAGLGPQ
jgi:ketosteroid isomerase-like protein